MLKFARELMHTGGEMPLTKLGTRMSDAIVEISSKGFGCVGVTDAHGMLVGIVTDGDLRRHMGPKLLDAKVEEVMTANPKVVAGDQLATEVLEILNSSKITTVFVAEGRKPTGILHMHDLLRAGVA
jgi:arabinose-5-phosphate isomerase